MNPKKKEFVMPVTDWNKREKKAAEVWKRFKAKHGKGKK